MKLLGLIGGTSWVSTIDYYRYINEGVNQHLGGSEFASCMLYSFNYGEIKKCLEAQDWDTFLNKVTESALHLKNAGAQAIVLCANTLHLIADEVAERVQLPVLHIAEATAHAIRKQNLHKVGLLGTKITMERDFFKARLKTQGIEAIIPTAEERDFIQSSIANELSKGIINPDTHARYKEICNNLIAQGAEGIILGCTEIPLLIHPHDLTVPSFDTTAIHAAAAVKFSLEIAN